MIITLLLYGRTHSYADLAGERLRSGARLTARGLLATMLRELRILIGAAIPLGWPSSSPRGLRGRLRGRQLLAQAVVGAFSDR